MSRLAKIALLAGFLFGPGAAAQTAPPADRLTPVEQWAWSLIALDQPADFNAHCGSTLDPRKPDGWDAPCRQISPRFLRDVLTVPLWRDQLDRPRVRLYGAHIAGKLDLADQTVAPELWLADSRAEGDVDLADSHWGKPLLLSGTTFRQAVFAQRLHADSAVFLRNASFQGPLDLEGATIEGTLEMGGAKFAGRVDLGSARLLSNAFLTSGAAFQDELQMRGSDIGGDLDLNGSSFAKSVSLDNSRVGGTLFMNKGARFLDQVRVSGVATGGDLDMSGASFARDIDASSTEIHRNLFLRDKATVKGDVNLIGSAIGGTLDLAQSSFAGLRASRADVRGSVFMNGATFSGEVNLIGAAIGSNFEASRAAFAGNVTADALHVGGDSLVDHTSFAGGLALIGARLGFVKLSGDTAADLDLSNASGDELKMDAMGWVCPGGAPATQVDPDTHLARPAKTPAHWPLQGSGWAQAHCDGPGQEPKVTLRNAHFAEFQDSADAWPPFLDLEGFHYDRLGGLEPGQDDMGQRPADDWLDWLLRSRSFSQQPYAQLSAVLAAAGHREEAEAILFAERDRERRQALDLGQPLRWGLLTVYRDLAGYGVGLYTFYAVAWVLVLTALGAGVVWFSPYARARGVLWCLGASLHRLLPVIELNKEFKDFFDNQPTPHGGVRWLGRFQVAYFSAHALSGWVLGFLVLAAMGVLVPK